MVNLSGAAVSFTGSAIKAGFKRIESFDISTDSQRVRLVAGGARLIKISSSDNESAVIEAVNAPKGFVGQGEKIDNLLEDHQKHRAKIYAAGHAAGPVVGVLYRPQDAFDVTGFYDSNMAAYHS